MKAVVHIRQRVEVEVPDFLVPTRRDRYSNTAAQEVALEAALQQLKANQWTERRSYNGRPYKVNPALGWIEWKFKE